MERDEFILFFKKRVFFSRAALALSYPHTRYTSAQNTGKPRQSVSG